MSRTAMSLLKLIFILVYKPDSIFRLLPIDTNQINTPYKKVPSKSRIRHPMAIYYTICYRNILIFFFIFHDFSAGVAPEINLHLDSDN